MKLKLTGALMATMGMGLASGVQAVSFFEDFSSPTLDPAWSVYENTGVRSNGLTSPANHYSLTDHPGYLRYYLDPMTSGNALTGIASPGYDLPLTFYRPLTGDQWTLESKIDFHMPGWGDDRSFSQLIGFGVPGPDYWQDGHVYYRDNFYSVNLLYFCQRNNCPYLNLGARGPADFPLWLRMTRNRGLLELFYSLDGQSWTMGNQHDWGSTLDGLDQRLMLSGSSWWLTWSSYADWDWVRFTSTAPSVPEPATLLLSLLGLGGLGLMRRRR